MTLFTPDHFIGRRKELRRIVNRLIKGESYALISEPRCGKTSLLEFRKKIVSPSTAKRESSYYLPI